MDIVNIDNILQYALLMAGREDEPFDRELGPIHLIKYVYLADLAYAEEHDGMTFTGVKWQFYKFGPWAQTVNGRIEPALSAIGAEKRTFPSDYEDREEWFRWRSIDDSPIRPLEKELPIIVTSSIKKNVHRFGKDTSELLAYVYTTLPMLSAAPNEFLDFSNLRRIRKTKEEPQKAKRKLSVKEKKILKEKREALKELASKKLAAKRRKPLVKPYKTPRYDDVYLNGMEWLDSLAGQKIADGESEVVFSDSIWKSLARRGENVPD